MRFLFAALLVSLGMAPAFAQAVPPLEIAVDYTYVRTNAPPGGCGCFALNGGSGEVAYHLLPKLSAVGNIGVVHAGNADATGLDLTFTSFLAGARGSYPIHTSRFTPYAQALIGAVYATGTLVPITSSGSHSDTVFAATVGGGLDIALTHHIALRAAQAEYFLTLLPNGTNDHQNNLRLSSGLVVRFGGGKSSHGQ